MLRRICIVLLILTLLLPCAGAETEAAENPFIGAWAVMYYVVDGVPHSPEELDYIDMLVISEEGIMTRHGDELSAAASCEVSGSTLLWNDLLLTLEGKDLLVCHDDELSVLFNRVDPLLLDNPFIGTWEVLLLQDGEMYSMEDYGQAAAVTFEAREMLLIDGDSVLRYPCTYADGRCTATVREREHTMQYTAFIQESGLLVLTISDDMGNIGYAYCAREDEQVAPAVLRFYGTWREIAAVSADGILTSDQLPLNQRPEGAGVLFQFEFSRAAAYRTCPELPELQDCWLLCTYTGDTCVIRYDGADAVCTIDDNGLMCIRSEDGSGVSWLVRVEEESPAGEAADTE